MNPYIIQINLERKGKNMRIRFLIGILVLGLVCGLNSRSVAEETVKMGILHSLSGTMAISEVSLRDVVLMAVEEINESGGVLGKKIEPVVVDPASEDRKSVV